MWRLKEYLKLSLKRKNIESNEKMNYCGLRMIKDQRFM